jgi:CubicO group peptidase (beta-lactamase class C family)
VEHHVPASDSTMYEVGSVTKQFTAAAIVMLAEQGRLRLDDPITRYLPEGSPAWAGVTLRHLLTHTSGVPQDTTLDWRRDYTEKELVLSAAALPLDFRPGEQESYSSTGYALLGIVVHRVTGRFWNDFLRDRIFRPLGMRTARVNSDLDIVPNRAAGYDLVNDTLKNQGWVSPSINATADCCLSLTVRDLAQWAVGLNHAKALSRAGQELSWTPVRLNDGGTYPYGLGWYIYQQRGYRRIGHSGAWRGFQATIQRYPDFDTTVIVLANLAPANVEGVALGIAGLLDPKLTAPHLLPGRLRGAAPPKPMERLLQDVASGKDSGEVTPGFAAHTSAGRRQQIARMLQDLQAWTFLGCDRVARGRMLRLGAHIDQICYGRGPVQENDRKGNIVFTVLYGTDWKAAGIDLYFF